MTRRLPPELVYHIIADIVGEYIDLAITGPTRAEEDSKLGDSVTDAELDNGQNDGMNSLHAISSEISNRTNRTN